MIGHLMHLGKVKGSEHKTVLKICTDFKGYSQTKGQLELVFNIVILQTHTLVDSAGPQDQTPAVCSVK